jgi:hypothetical protein
VVRADHLSTPCSAQIRTLRYTLCTTLSMTLKIVYSMPLYAFSEVCVKMRGNSDYFDVQSAECRRKRQEARGTCICPYLSVYDTSTLVACLLDANSSDSYTCFTIGGECTPPWLQ